MKDSNFSKKFTSSMVFEFLMMTLLRKKSTSFMFINLKLRLDLEVMCKKSPPKKNPFNFH
jgi:hypothetical protein